MTLIIGNSRAAHRLRGRRARKRRSRGFTLMEIMVATVVLSLGIVLIYEAFFISLDTFNYCSDYLRVVSLADEKVWRAQESLSRLGPLARINTEGSIVEGNKVFDWRLSYDLIDGPPDLYKIDLTLSRRKGKRKVSIARSAYAIYREEE